MSDRLESDDTGCELLAAVNHATLAVSSDLTSPLPTMLESLAAERQKGIEE